jgi:hypothetical protein
MKQEMEIYFIVGRLRNNPTDEESERAADLIIELYRECTELGLQIEKSSQDYWSK